MTPSVSNPMHLHLTLLSSGRGYGRMVSLTAMVDLESAVASWVDRMGGGRIVVDGLQNMLSENLAEGDIYCFR